ncbi:hypothetical protein V8E36_007737 [Tilletia maclaganii]
MISSAFVSAAISPIRDGGMSGLAVCLPSVSSTGHTISLFKQVPRAHFTAESETDVHDHIAAEVNRLTAKYYRHFDNYKEATGVPLFLDNQPEQLFQKRRTGHLPLTPVRDGELWAGMISIGAERHQTWLAARFDTGATDTVINPGQYDYARSRSSRRTGEFFRLTFSDHTQAQGKVILDTVAVGDLEARHVAIGIVMISTVNVVDYQSIVGMASMVPPALSALRLPGLIPSLMAQGSLQRHVFCFGLWKDEGARLDLGHIAQQYRGQIAWTPVVETGYRMWLTTFAISGVAEPQTGFVDTGTSLIVGPYRAVYDVIVAAGMSLHVQDGQVYGVYLTDGPTPHVSISIAGLDVVLSADSLAYRVRGALTVAGIVGREGLDGWWLLVDTFLQSVYVVFDAEGQRIGFAPRQANS